MMKPVYDGNGNKIEFDTEKVFADSSQYTIYELNDNQLLKVFNSDVVPDSIRSKIEFIFQNELMLSDVHFPQAMVYSDQGAPIGYKFRKPAGFNLLRSIFIKSQFNRLFPTWYRENLVLLSIAFLKLVKQLHQNSILIGNLNPKNVYVKSDTEISVINADEFVYLKNAKLEEGFTYQHDDFVIAVYLFMILIPGKPPFPVQLGSNAVDNLRSMFMEYSGKTDADWEVPDDDEMYLWDNLSENIRVSFQQIFNNKKRLTEDMWIQQLENYRAELQENKHIDKIYKKDKSRESFKYTTSMNLHDGGFGSDRTILCDESKPNCKVAVIELSTKAVKLLIGEKNCVKASFEFDAFSRTADLTNTGKGLDENNRMSLDFFKSAVAPSIEKFIKIAQDSGVTELYTVATAAYRAARNNDEILKYIKNRFNINVRILSKEEEAQASFNAFVFSGRQFIEAINDCVILVDQGGGSTEISFFQNLKLAKSISLNLGTTVLQNILLNKSSLNLSLIDALQETDNILQTRMKHYFEDIEEFTKFKNISCIALGSAITTATYVRGNKNQHGTKLTAREIAQRIRETEQKIVGNFRSIRELMDTINKENSYKRSALENLLIMRLGLPMFLKIFEYFDIDELVVSGTGLWYGIFWQRCLQSNGNE